VDLRGLSDGIHWGSRATNHCFAKRVFHGAAVRNTAFRWEFKARFLIAYTLSPTDLHAYGFISLIFGILHYIGRQL
jgi:hypothetical protein